ncbi:hypothetical protein DBR06_SOUSAS29710025, partial [Sousa chinensis]
NKLYQRDLEVTSVLPVKEPSTDSTGVQGFQGKGIEKCGSTKTKTMNKLSQFSNCSTISDYLNLDEITEDDLHDG